MSQSVGSKYSEAPYVRATCHDLDTKEELLEAYSDKDYLLVSERSGYEIRDCGGQPVKRLIYTLIFQDCTKTKVNTASLALIHKQ